MTGLLPEILLSALILTATVATALLAVRYGKKTKSYGLDPEAIDEMSGYDFEELAAFLLKENGAEIISVTKKSGDFGADIIIKLDGETIAVQCKRSGGNVGVKAVQEAKTAENYYNAKRSAVFTNSGFTKQAVRLADENDVILWDREALVEFINKSNGKIKKNGCPDVLRSVKIHIMPVIEPLFPHEGIEITVNKNEDRLLLTGENAVTVNVREGKGILLFKSGKMKAMISFTAEPNENISYAAGYAGKNLFVYKVKR